MIRLTLACVGLGAMCVLSTVAAGTPFAVPVGLGAALFGVAMVFYDRPESLDTFERRQPPTVFRCGSPEDDWIRDLRDAG